MTSVRLFRGDSAQVLRRLIADGVKVHSIVCDPPYYLESVAKRFGKKGSAAAKFGSDGRFSRQSRRFMGETWDSADDGGYRIAHDPEFWKLCYDILLPGGFCLAFSSASTGHRQAVAMEDAGFIHHPFHAWVYGSGMPKAHSVVRHDPSLVEYDGWYHGKGTIKPALEPVYFCQRPPSEKSNAANVAKHGVGAYNIEGCRVGDYWPANLMHDGSDQALSCFPAGEDRFFARFDSPVAYTRGKATDEDRAGSKHPTVKPVALMAHFVRMVTPKGGVVLDPFAGSGTTGEAALREGMSAILVEREAAYCADIIRRFEMSNPYIEALGINR